MPGNVLVYDFYGKFVTFSIADIHLYDMVVDTLSKKEGQERYGMKFIVGIRDIPDDKWDEKVKDVSLIVERKNKGEAINLEEEVKALS